MFWPLCMVQNLVLKIFNQSTVINVSFSVSFIFMVRYVAGIQITQILLRAW